MTREDAEDLAIVLERCAPNVGAALCQADKVAAAVAWSARNKSAREIGAALGVTSRTVVRWRRAARLTEATT